MKKWKSVKNGYREKRKLVIRKNGIWGNGYWEEYRFGRIKIWKIGFSENTNLEKCKFGEM